MSKRLKLFGRRDKGSKISSSPTVIPTNRRQSVLMPLQQRIQQCMATETLYETQLQQLKDLDNIGDQLQSHETEMARTLQHYTDSNLSRSSTNPQVLDLIDISEQLSSALTSLAKLRTELTRQLEGEAVANVDKLMMASKPPDDVPLNDNQLELETEHVLNLRNAGLSKSLTSIARGYMNYFEQGAAVMKNMKMIVESIESRAVAELPSRPAQSTKLFGEPLRQVMGRYEETLPIPSQIEHCLQYVEKNAYHDAGVYRVPGHAGEIDRLKAMLDEGKFPNFDSLEIQNKHHTICGIIKLYVRELPEPLLTFEKFDDFVAVAKVKEPKEQSEQLHALLDGLPMNHHALLKRLVRTFQLVINNEESNKMNANSIAISFGLNLMRLKTEDSMKLMTSTPHINKVCELIISDPKLLEDDGYFEGDDLSSVAMTPRGRGNSNAEPPNGNSLPKENGVLKTGSQDPLSESPLRKTQSMMMQ